MAVEDGEAAVVGVPVEVAEILPDLTVGAKGAAVEEDWPPPSFLFTAISVEAAGVEVGVADELAEVVVT